MPRVTVAGGLRFDVVRAVVNRQLQRIGAGTAVSVVVMVFVSAGCGVSRPMPSVALANRLCLHIMRAVIDGQHQRVEGRASADTCVGVVVGARRVVGGAMPSIAVAGLLGVRVAFGVAQPAHGDVAACGGLAAVAPHRPNVVVVVAVVDYIVAVRGAASCAKCRRVAVYLVVR